MAISSTPTDYSNLCTGALAAAITTSTSTGVTVTADTFLTPAGNGAVTWPTGNQIWKVSRKTRTNTQVEFLGVESLSQSGTAITTGAIVRYLPSNGSSLASQGSGLTFPAGSTVELVWHAWNAEQSFYKDVVNTITGSGAIRSSSTTTPIIRLNNVTTTQRNAMTPSNGDMVYDTTDNLTYGYVGGAWTNLTGGSVADSTTASKGKIQQADLAAVNAGTLNRALTADLVKQNSTGAAQGNIVALNSSAVVDKTLLATGTPTSAKYLRGDGTWQTLYDTAVLIFGAKSLGNVTLNTNTTLTSDAYYDTLDLSTYTLNTAGYRVFANRITGSGKIAAKPGAAGGAGGNASGTTPGSAGSAAAQTTGNTLPDGPTNTAGAAGTAGSGSSSSSSGSAGGHGGAAAIGGDVGGTVGTPGTSTSGSLSTALIMHLCFFATNKGATWTQIQGIAASTSGSGGGTSSGGGGAGGGGGAHGANGGYFFIAASTIDGSWTIESLGGAGGAGGAGGIVGGAAGGGGGGGGGGGAGGCGVLVYRDKTSWTGSATLTGGTGGTGGALGTGTSNGVAGANGSNGAAGTLLQIQVP